MTGFESRMIWHDEADDYRAKGWAVGPAPGHHAARACIATREIPDRPVDREPAP
jgi:hypothetical protein